MGSVTIAAWIALAAFWILLGYGLLRREIELTVAIVFIFLWIAGVYGLPFLPYGQGLFLPYVAVLDIALVFRIFHGDVRLT